MSELTPTPASGSLPPTASAAPNEPTRKEKWLRFKRAGYPTIIRENKPGTKFSARIRFRKDVHFVTLAETVDDSFTQALAARREISAGRWQELRAKVAIRGFTTVEDLLTTYDTTIATVNDRIESITVRNNIANFKNFLHWAHGRPEKELDFKSLSLQKELTPETVADFKTNYLAIAGENRELREQRRRGAEAVLRQVRSMFSGSARLAYKKLQLPELKEFLQHARVNTEDRIHLTIASETLREIHNAMEQLRLAKSPLWIIHALHKFGLLRTDEICHVRAEWFNRAPWGQVFLSIITRPYFEPKKSQGHIPIAREVAALMAPYVLGKSGQEHIVPAKSESERRRLVEREHAAWMRQYLPADRFAKAGYELRRFGSQAIRARYGDGAGEAALRHSVTTVAARHYFEHFYPWQNHGPDVGVRIEDVVGTEQNKIAQIWVEGADALAGLENSEPENLTSLRQGHKAP